MSLVGVMHTLFAILCSLIVLAPLLGEARLNHLHLENTLRAEHAVQTTGEFNCHEGSGHGACQTLLSSQDASPVPWLAFATSQFELVPVRASSRIASPQPPPPRYVS